jgi:hypothetical protein
MKAPRCWQLRYDACGDVGNCGMMPVAMLRPVQIHHIFIIPTCSLSSLCVACIIVQYKYSLHMQVEGGKG